MSLVIDKATSDPIHSPRRRDVFEWDAEVASIFDNMALRSIPMYAEAHRIHASLLRRYAEKCFKEYRVSKHDHVTVADIGASTGAFLKTLCDVYGCKIDDGISHIDAIAFDNSHDMLDGVKRAMPWVHTIHHDVTEGFDSINIDFDFVNISYLLQFLPQGTRLPILKSIANRMTAGGMLFLSHKESIEDELTKYLFTNEYIQFRKDNGYSDQEIRTKTQALKGSMWVDTFDFTKELLEHSGFSWVQPTSRWLNFSSMVCFRNG